MHSTTQLVLIILSKLVVRSFVLQGSQLLQNSLVFIVLLHLFVNLLLAPLTDSLELLLVLLFLLLGSLLNLSQLILRKSSLVLLLHRLNSPLHFFFSLLINKLLEKLNLIDTEFIYIKLNKRSILVGLALLQLLSFLFPIVIQFFVFFSAHEHSKHC